MQPSVATRSSSAARTARQPAGSAVAVLLGAAAWGSTGTAAHFAPAGAGTASIGAARIAVGGGLLLVIALATAQRRRAVRALLSAGGSARISLLLAAAAVAGYQVCFFAAVRMTGVAIGTVVAIGSAPVFTGALTRLTGGPRLGSRWMLATTAAVAGCTVLVAAGKAAGADPGGITLALTAGLCYAIYAVTAARLISTGSPEAAVMGLLFGGAAVLLAPLLAVNSPGWVLSARGLAVVGYLGVITTAAAYLLYGRGLRRLSAPVAVTLGLAEPVVAAMLGLVVLGERLTPVGLLGLLLVGLALATLVLPPSPNRPKIT
ncbi:MAG TPA: EamA family transporter [Streptosporangiaceae bacterium]|nr:EamA family transporter [Streptosporangiaceae bacterium]